MLISNGISVSKIQEDYIESWSPNNELIKIIMVASFDNWHGVDRIIKSVIRSESPVELHLVGGGNVLDELVNEFNLSSNPKVILHGFQKYEDIMKLYQTMDLAISSLGLHRIGLQRASVLKTREYLASGLPVVVAYDDTDLCNLDLSFIFKISNDDSLIDLSSIIGWYQATCADRSVKRKIINFAKKNLTYEVKALDFLK